MRYIKSKISLIVLFIIFLTGCGIQNNTQSKFNADNHNQDEKTYDNNTQMEINAHNQWKNDSLDMAEIEKKAGDGSIIIKWAFPTMSFDMYDEPIEMRLNSKLAEDGYNFRLECVYIDYKDYNNLVKDCDADIVWTGIRDSENIKSLSPAYSAIKENKYLCLDQYLKGSSLYNLYPELLWESVRINDSIYCIPNTVMPDCGLAIALKKDKYTEEEINRFDNTLEGILSLLGDEGVLYYSGRGCDYLDMYEIPNELVYMYFEEGKIKNLMENEINIRWIRALNNLAVKGQICESGAVPVIEYGETPEWDIAFLNTGEVLNLDDEKFWKIYYKGDSGDNFKASTAIRVNSKNPDIAFKLIELLMTDSEYGNLFLYGNEVIAEKGYAINPENGRKLYIFPSKMYLGINDGVLRGEMDYYSFGTPKERADYYEKYIRKGNTSWMEYPEFSGELYYLIEKHEKMITNTKNFEEELAECIEEVKAAFKLIK